MPLSQADLLEQVTGELYRRFLHDTAEVMQEWASSHPHISMGLFDFRNAMEWALHFEKLVPKLRNMIEVVTVFTYADAKKGEDVILYRALEYGWIESSGGLTEHRRLYESKVSVSHMMVDRASREQLEWVREEVERTLMIGFADMFEEYLAEGLCPLVPIPEKAMTG